MCFHYCVCLWRLTENFRLLVAGAPGEKYAQGEEGTPWGQHNSVIKALGCAPPMPGRWKQSEALQKQTSTSPLGLQTRLGAVPCFGHKKSSALALLHSKAGHEVLSPVLPMLCALWMSRGPCSGLCVVILALHLFNHVFAFFVTLCFWRWWFVATDEKDHFCGLVNVTMSPCFPEEEKLIVEVS